MATNGISTLATKEARQIAKLELAAVERAAAGRRSVYDLSELPTKYSGNSVVDNLNSGGLTFGRPWSSSETPNLFSGLTIWYDTATASTINSGTFSDGTTVTTLTNRATSTNGTPQSGREPTVQNGVGDTLNGYPVVRFATAGSYDSIRFATDAFDSATGWTVVMLAKIVSTAGFNPSLFMITDSAGSTVTGVRYLSTSYFYFYCPTGAATVNTNIDPTGSWKIITMRYDSTAAVASRCTFKWDKTNISITNGGIPPSGTVSNTAAYVETMSAWNGDLAEQVIYNRALTDDEITALEDYLSAKWLPSTLITENLVFNLDPESTSSYPGTGTTWYDIAGTAQNLTLVGTPTFTNTTPKYFTFNGTTQRATGADTGVIPTTTYTKSIWFYLNGYQDNNLFSGDGHFIYMGPSASVDKKIYCGHSNWGSFTAFPSTQTVDLSKWYNVTLTFSTTNGMSLYINGVLDSTYTAQKTAHPGTGTVNIGSYDTGNLLNGRVGRALAYNTELTAAQVLQIFNATKSVYGV